MDKMKCKNLTQKAKNILFSKSSLSVYKTQTSKLIKTRFSALLRFKHIDQTNVLTHKWLNQTKDKYPHEQFSPLLSEHMKN